MSVTSRVRQIAIATVAVVVASLFSVAAPPAAQAVACATTPTILEWNSTLAGGLTAAVPVRTITANTTIDWGDGSTPTSITFLNALLEHSFHTYGSAGTYTISICGGVKVFGAAVQPYVGVDGYTKVTSIGSTISDLGSAFAYMTNLSDVPNYLPPSVTSIRQIFGYTNNFNDPDVLSWNTVNVTVMAGAFYQTGAFNQPIADYWNTTNVTSMGNMFMKAAAFDQNVGALNTTNVTDMSNMFRDTEVFNNAGSDSMKNWNTSRVTNMFSMFSGAKKFNQPIGSWNVSAVTGMSKMFNGAKVFNQDISAWSPTALTDAAEMWANTDNVMSVDNYDKLLNSWSKKVLKNLVRFGFGTHQFTCAAEAAKITMQTSPLYWTITDGSLLETAPTISTIVPGDQKLSVYFTAPTCMSTKRTTYQYSLDGGTTWVSLATPSLASPIVITGLTNGTTYRVKVRPYGYGGGLTPSFNGKASDEVSAIPANGVTFTANAQSSAYGASVPTIGYTSTLAPGDFTQTIACGAYTDNTYATAVTSATKPGTYVTHCTGSATSGLGVAVRYVDGVYTVTKAPLTITAKSFTKTYGDALSLSGATDFTVNGLVGSDAVSSVTLTTTGNAAGAGVTGSPYSVVPSAAVGAASQVLTQWYTITYTNGSITANKAPALQVMASTNIYGIDYTSVPANAAAITSSVVYSASGFVNGETFATVGYTAPTCGVFDGLTLKSPNYSSLAVGIYAVKCAGGAAANYEGISYVAGIFTVKAANVAVTAKSANSAYGSAVSAPSPGYDVVGDLNGVTVTCAAYTDNTYVTAVTSSTKPGTYVTHCSGPANNGAPDYTLIEYTDGVYTVAKVPLTVTAKSWSKTYGDAITLAGASDFTSSGLVNGDGIASVTLTTSGAVGTAGVAGSPYSVVPSAAVGAASQVLTDYYDITYVDGAITVARKSLTVEADDVTLQVGASVPTSYSASYTGWVNGENDDTTLPAGWVAPVCTSSFNSNTPLGTPVEVTCSGGATDDYEFTFVSGSVTVGNPEVTVQNTTKTAVETTDSTVNVSLSARITNWAPGCKVTFTLNPSAGTASPYTVYTTASNDVSVNAALPVGVYDITTSVSEGCTGTSDTTGIVAVVPIGPGGAAHTDAYGVRYFDPTTGKTFILNMEWKRDRVRTRNPVTGLYQTTWGYNSYFNWSQYGAKTWRIVSKPFPGRLSLDGGASTVSTWGLMTCPTGMYPVGNASICSAATNTVTIQRWVPSGSSGSWQNVGDALMVFQLAEGAWPYRCATVACKTPLRDRMAISFRSLPGAAAITFPVGFPTTTDWRNISAGDIIHKGPTTISP